MTPQLVKGRWRARTSPALKRSAADGHGVSDRRHIRVDERTRNVGICRGAGHPGYPFVVGGQHVRGEQVVELGLRRSLADVISLTRPLVWIVSIEVRSSRGMGCS
jgi:hypothetical protein